MTDSYLTLTTFVPGTKAKADEVNANFLALKDAINTKAATSGDSNKTFSVADATLDKQAVNKSQLAALSADLTAEINKSDTKFCAKSGNTTNGSGDLFSYDVLRIIPKIAGTYKNLIFADYEGTQTIISSTPAIISMSGKPDGDYNIFIKPDGTIYTLDNTIYRQSSRPTMLDGDIWLDTSVEPFNCVKYDGTNDVQFLDVPLGIVTVKNALITAIATLPFGQNGYNVNLKTALDSGTNLANSIPKLLMPNYAVSVSKAWGTTYTAESNGYVYGFVHGFSDSQNWFAVNGVKVWAFTSGGGQNTFFIPVSKGDSYLAKIGGGDSSVLVFHPCLGV